MPAIMPLRAPIVVLGTARMPIGSFQGALATIPAARLGAIAIKAALERSPVSADVVSDVLMGGESRLPQERAELQPADCDLVVAVMEHWAKDGSSKILPVRAC